MHNRTELSIAYKIYQEECGHILNSRKHQTSPQPAAHIEENHLALQGSRRPESRVDKWNFFWHKNICKFAVPIILLLPLMQPMLLIVFDERSHLHTGSPCKNVDKLFTRLFFCCCCKYMSIASKTERTFRNIYSQLQISHHVQHDNDEDELLHIYRFHRYCTRTTACLLLVTNSHQSLKEYLPLFL